MIEEIGIDPTRPVLIAGPTGAGKSALALAIARARGGVIVNADALQVYAGWRILTARPTLRDEAEIPHLLYGHVPQTGPYSVGQWLREVGAILDHDPRRAIIVGGTGLYFRALTEGLADIPPIPPEVRANAEIRLREGGPGRLLADLDPETRAMIDTRNPVRVQRAWEVLRATGRGLASWQRATPPPRLPLSTCQPVLIEAAPEWLNPRIEARFDQMLDAGALEEVRGQRPVWQPAHPSARAIGAAQLMACLDGETTLPDAVIRAKALSRQYAKRQRTWFRARMRGWQRIHLP